MRIQCKATLLETVHKERWVPILYPCTRFLCANLLCEWLCCFSTFFGGRKSWRDAIGELLFFSVFIGYYRNRFVASVILKSTNGIFFFSHSSNYYLRCSLYASDVLACSDITILCTISISWGLAIQFLGLADEMIRIQHTICEITTFYLPVKPTNIASNKQIFVSNKTYVCFDLLSEWK